MDTNSIYYIVDNHPKKAASKRIPTAFPDLQQAVNALGFLRRHCKHPECLSIEQEPGRRH